MNVCQDILSVATGPKIVAQKVHGYMVTQSSYHKVEMFNYRSTGLVPVLYETEKKIVLNMPNLPYSICLVGGRYNSISLRYEPFPVQLSSGQESHPFNMSL